MSGGYSEPMKARFVVFGTALLLGLTACGKKEAAPPAKATNTTTGGNPLTAPADYVGAVGQAQKYSVKAIDLASVTKAIEMFHASEDRYPKSLEELVKTQYLPALPQLPTGMKYEYDANTGRVKAVRTP